MLKALSDKLIAIQIAIADTQNLKMERHILHGYLLFYPIVVFSHCFKIVKIDRSEHVLVNTQRMISVFKCF